MALRAWRIGSSERIWAVAIALACAVFLITLLLTSKWLDTNQAGISTSVPMQAAPSTKVETQHIQKETELALPVSTTKQPPVDIITPTPKPAIITVHKKVIAKTHSAPQSLPSTQAKHGYFVQIGAFRDQQHALNLQARLAAKEVNVDIANKKGLYAVLAGPYATDAAAQSAKQSLAASHHLAGFVTHR